MAKSNDKTHHRMDNNFHIPDLVHAFSNVDPVYTDKKNQYLLRSLVHCKRVRTIFNRTKKVYLKRWFKKNQSYLNRYFFFGVNA